MGFFRFRRSIRILPGVRLNLGKTGISTSIGVRGAQLTLGRGKVRTTVGLPGTGLSYTDVKPLADPSLQPARKGRGWRLVGLIVLLLWIAFHLGPWLKN